MEMIPLIATTAVGPKATLSDLRRRSRAARACRAAVLCASIYRGSALRAGVGDELAARLGHRADDAPSRRPGGGGSHGDVDAPWSSDLPRLHIGASSLQGLCMPVGSKGPDDLVGRATLQAARASVTDMFDTASEVLALGVGSAGGRVVASACAQGETGKCRELPELTRRLRDSFDAEVFRASNSTALCDIGARVAGVMSRGLAAQAAPASLIGVGGAEVELGDAQSVEHLRRRRGNESEVECPICLQPDPAQPQTSLRCGHHFCEACVQAWLRREGSCPMCRTRIGPSRGEQEAAAAAARERLKSAMAGIGSILLFGGGGAIVMLYDLEDPRAWLATDILFMTGLALWVVSIVTGCAGFL